MGARRTLIRWVGPRAAATLAVAGCVPGFGGLPTHHDMNAYPAGLLTGTVVRDGDCVYVDTGGDGRDLPIWQSGTILAGSALVRGSHIVAVTGDVVALSGGEYSGYNTVRDFLESDVREACRGTLYWLVASVDGGY